MLKKLLIAICLMVSVVMFFFSGTVSGATCTTTVPAGTVVGQTWTVNNSPYCVTGDIQVSLLTIEPGVEVLVDGAYEINVMSTITAIGTETSPIIFSAKEPLAPANQRWKGLRFQNTPPGSNFTYVIIEYSNDHGVDIINGAPVVFDNCVFRSNSTTGNGGAVSASSISGDLNFTNCEFTGNTSSVHGGALYINMNTGLTLTIADSVFKNNIANPSYTSGDYVGGALYFTWGANAEISNTLFRQNQSNSRCSGTFDCGVTARGGAIYISSSGTVTITNSEFLENKTDARNNGNCFFGGSSNSFGGGVYVQSGTVNFINDILSCNTTVATNCGPQHGGGGLYVNGGTVAVVNNTIARNSDATGISRAAGSLDVKNSIIYFNNGNGTQIGGTTTATYSDIQGGYTGTGNINFNPVFAGTGCSIDDFKIVLGSPAIDAGNPDPIYNDGCLPPGLGTVINDMGAFGGPDNCGWMPLSPVPDIKANGSDGPVTVTQNDNLSVTIALDDGDFSGDNADWWVLADTPFGWYYYNLSSGWQPGMTVTYQGPLFDLSTYEVLSASGLPLGSYTFYFGADMIMNGSIDLGPGEIYYDSVGVTITPGQ
ncbi:MAG: hypothetical protein HY757_07665 [Nitrospirae bacterium]|nr:hypothetical protein [Nitrospirota bacterium]